MVNVPGRSRGCATCRKRKVKCDNGLPECRRCLNMGLPCPGPRTGAFYVHALPGPSPGAASPRVRLLPPENPSPPSLVWLPGPPPSRASAFDQLFVSHFIDSFFGSMKPPPAPGTPPKLWLHELPGFLASPDPSPAYPAKHAIRAASMLSYGSLAGDVPIKTAASRWYTKALQDLQRVLSCPTDSAAATGSTVCAIVMLIHFETWAGTNQTAWLQHIKGAVRLLQQGGSECCRDGFMHQIFSHLRLQAFVAAMAENDLSAFASPDWMTIPFDVYPKSVFDQLIDFLFTAQRCLDVARRLISSTGEGTGDLVAELEALIQNAMVQSQQWWTGCMLTSNFGEAASRAADGTEGPSLAHTNIPAASMCSLYDAANLVVLRLVHLVSPSAATHDQRVRQHAQSILSANQLVNAAAGSTPDRGSTMMVLQLKIVSLWSPSAEQRDAAAEGLRAGKVQGGGLSCISAVSPMFFADVAAHIREQDPSG